MVWPFIISQHKFTMYITIVFSFLTQKAVTKVEQFYDISTKSNKYYGIHIDTSLFKINPIIRSTFSFHLRWQAVSSFTTSSAYCFLNSKIWEANLVREILTSIKYPF